MITADLPLLSLPTSGPPPLPAEVGGKAHHLARLRALGLPVPAWLVLRADAPAGADFRREVVAAIDELGLGDGLLAVRSSATVEDSGTASFAGQFRTVLGVTADGLWEAIEQVRESVDSECVRTYLARHPELPAPRMAVIIQQWIDAAVSGVLFTRDPLTGEGAVINAVAGSGDQLVSGQSDAETYRAFDGRIERAGVLLTEAEVRELAEIGRRVSAALGADQDIEWCLDRNRRLHLLQTRPITTSPGRHRAGPTPLPGERRLWDNSNIVESYGGVTTPLTFSFARASYEQAYRQLCRVLGVEERLLDERREVFAHMLGFIRGRIYYNLLNWYRALALLPGYSFNRAFMERMMGVREKLADPPETPYAASRARDLWRLVRMACRLLKEQHRLPAEVRRFHARVESALEPLAGPGLEGRSLDELAALYRRLERDLLERWRAPLVNDFLAMIYFGLLGRMVEKWLPEAPAALTNDLLIGEGGIISTEPAVQVRRLAKRVAEDATLAAVFGREADNRALWDEIEARFPAYRHAMGEYIERFGDRAAGELKIETITPRQEPWQILAYVRSAADSDPGHRGGVLRARAEGLAVGTLRGWRRAAFRAVLGRTRARVRDRENLRFERTRVFGLARRIFLAMGSRLAEEGALADARDVVYLTREELLGRLEGAEATGDFRSLVALRRAEFASHLAAPPPPDRFETYGPPAYYQVDASPRAVCPGDLQGTGCCPGVVRARVRVVSDPAAAGDLRGRILVAERTDPGWTLLFPAAAGLLVQRGSLLSHSAIVAREIGLPCIVSIPGLLTALADGEWVEMDGATGTVRRVAA